jgi:hypothetical protein
LSRAPGVGRSDEARKAHLSRRIKEHHLPLDCDALKADNRREVVTAVGLFAVHLTKE